MKQRTIFTETHIIWALTIYLFLCLIFILMLQSRQVSVNQVTTIKMARSEKPLESHFAALFDSDTFIRSYPERRYLTHSEGQTTAKFDSSPVRAPHNLVPESYTETIVPMLDFPVYVFIDSTGVTQYRIFIKRSKTNEDVFGYVRAQQNIKGLQIEYSFNPDDIFVLLDKEQFGVVEPNEILDNPYGLEKVYGIRGLYQSNKGSKAYYVYGHYPNRKDEYYAADSTGNMIPGKLSVIPDNQ